MTPFVILKSSQANSEFPTFSLHADVIKIMSSQIPQKSGFVVIAYVKKRQDSQLAIG
jgi:hypothetical protein